MFKRLLKSDFMLFLLTMFLLTSLSGCATKEVITITEYKAVLPEDHLLADCEIEAPPTRKAYLGDVSTATSFSIAATSTDPSFVLLSKQLEKAAHREKLLIEFGMNQTKNVQLCNKDKKALRDWKTKSKQVVETGPPVARKKE